MHWCITATIGKCRVKHPQLNGTSHAFVFIKFQLSELHLRHSGLQVDEGCEYYVVDVIAPFVDRRFTLNYRWSWCAWRAVGISLGS